ncbi:YjcZ family sporulation protein [Halalkalibacter flavus]
MSGFAHGGGFALIVVLFILLVIIGCACAGYGY